VFDLGVLIFVFMTMLCAYKSVQSWVCMVPLEVSKKRFGGRKRIIQFLALDPISTVKKDWAKRPKLLDEYLASWEAVCNGEELYNWSFSFFVAAIATIILIAMLVLA